MNNAIKCASQAVELTPDGDSAKLGYLKNLVNSLRHRFERLGDLADVDKAVGCMSRAVELTPDGQADKSDCLNNLGILCQLRFERLEDSSDDNKAIEYTSRAVELTPDSSPAKPGRLQNLAVMWKHRFERFGDLTYIDKAIDCASRAVELTLDVHPAKPFWLNFLGNSWYTRFERLSRLVDIDKAIEYQLHAVELTPDGHSQKPGRLTNLANSWRSRFVQLGNIADIDKAIEYQARAIDLTPDGQSDKPGYLMNLGYFWKCRSEDLGDLGGLDKAVELETQSVELTPDYCPKKRSRLRNLVSLHNEQFGRSGKLTEIDKAMDCTLRAIKYTPDGHPDRPGLLGDRAFLQLARFGRIRNLTDLDNAIEYSSQAVELTPDGHPEKPTHLDNLGNSSRSRFERLKHLADIDMAVKCQSQAAELTPDSSPDKPGFLHNLGMTWFSRFEQYGDPSDLEKAIECASRANKLTPDGRRSKPRLLSNLGRSLKTRFEKLGNLADIDEAIECQSRAVELAPGGHPEKSDFMNNLGCMWQSRFVGHGMTVDLESSITCFKNAAEGIIASPREQLLCARHWAKNSLRLGRSPLSAYQRAFALLPQIVSLGQTRQERYHSLLSVSNLAAEAAAWAVSVNLYDFALEWLEQGRSIVWSQTLQLRTPLDELAETSPNLADRLREIASQLDIAISRSQAADISGAPHQDLESQAQRHRRLAERWDELLAEARQLPGFEGFMLPRTSADLKRAATDGPVVVINTYSTRCDALAIFPECEGIAHIPLKSLENQNLPDKFSQMISLVGRQACDARSVKYFPPPVASQDNLQPLKDLWLSVVGPVLDTLAYTSKRPYDELLHVTWCATGALSFLPLHAAGLYDGQSLSAFDRVVSSYTPTLSALLPRSGQMIERAQGVLAVGQSNTPGQPPLLMTTAELATVKKYTHATFYHQLDGASATVSATLDAMEQHSWVHLACHGVQNHDNPSHSAFYLHDGCLTLEEIAKRQFKNKGLAFLSACQTATGDSTLPDEATHLAAGMLTAGYPSVIATMWSIRDDDAPEIAEEVYAELMKNEMMDHKRTAIALHKAVGKLREKVGAEAIDRWAPFIHVGV